MPEMVERVGMVGETRDMIRVRRYGMTGPWVIVLHGGPAAVGDVAPVARGLCSEFRVLEPWQRGSSQVPLTVARHVKDLHEVIERECTSPRPALVGHSWGAMLALAYAAAHPRDVGPVVLIGCGTFDSAARRRLWQILDERTDRALRRKLDALRSHYPDLHQRLEKRFELTRGLYAYDPLPDEVDLAKPARFDVQAHIETWEDMMRLQENGVYPAAFSRITSPVLMLHGADDPHPGPLIRTGLMPVLPQLEYHEWPCCGHTPWLERRACQAFFDYLRGWLLESMGVKASNPAPR